MEGNEITISPIMPPKRPHSATTPSSNGSTAAPPMYEALSTRSGNVVVLGLQPCSSVNCAGMALLRVFQGHAEVLGWRPPLATYYPVHSPKWSSLLVVEARSRDSVVASSSHIRKTKAVHDAESQGAFSDASAQLLAAMEPHAAALVDMEEEQEADRLARQIAELYAVVLVFRAMPVSYGNVMCYFEVPTKHDVVLPGFKIIVTKDAYQSLSVTTTNSSSMANEGTVTHDAKTSAQVLGELAVGDPSRLIQVPHGWSSTVDAIEHSLVLAAENKKPPQRIVVCGGKDVGKSTFCRYLVNRLLSFFETVAFLDTDVGQPELTPPGLISLHALTAPLLGPGFTHMKTPLRSFFCGGTNPGTDPLYYVKSVKSVLRLHERKWTQGGGASETVPLVINTDGWVKSMGHDLLCSVIADADPHHVVQLLSTTRSKQFDVPTTGGWTIHSVAPWDPSMSIVQAPRSSKEMRLYRLHSYFLSHTSCDDLARAQLQNLHFLAEKDRLNHAMGRAYASAIPFAVSFDAVDVAFACSPVPPSQLLASLNCSIVGLCMNPRRSAVEEDEIGYARPPRIQVQPVHAPCVGVAVVRAIDAERRLLFLLTPVPLRILQHVNLLVRASVSLDPLLLGALEGPVASPYVVTDVIASDGTGSGAMQSRNNIKRKRDGGK